ncbi:UNVERIFIED_CONTAM: hypothetical protein GTU68_000737, partial [Idotea baltica]|nr:hypothetical protein [Idotea baltica]
RFQKAIERASQTDIPELFKTALAAGDSHLKERFLEGEDIHKLVRDRSAFIDRIIYYVWMQQEWDDGIALMAVGGYGRGEMHPHSDIDLLFTLRRNNPEKYRERISEFLTFLWDLQLTIGHSVRTVRQNLSACKDDLTIMTNLLEFRTVIGPTDLGEALSKKIYGCWSSEDFFRGKVEEQSKRHAKHGITEFDLEPNVKESPGGLRDIQTIHWVAKRAFRVSGLEKLAGKGFYTEAEYNSLKAAETFLWKVRFGMHVLSNKMHDHLQFEHQRQLAELFGFKDTDKRRAVEQFMQRYYRAATTVREITDVLIQTTEKSIFGAKHKKIRPLNARFQLRGNYVEAVSETVFKDFPSSLLEVFVILSRDREIEGIHAETIRQIRENGYLIDEDFRANELNRRLFVELLKSPNNLSVPLQKMSRYGILGRYLPEFGQIIGLTQHDLFHIYPVDIHTLAVVRNLRDFGLPESRKQFPVSSYTYSSYPKPEILIVAGLYHDIGKGKGGDHSELGAIEVERFGREHGFSPTEVRLMVWLVENHLFMSRVAQREDISDPEVIANFARHVGDETRLNLLYTLTTADILATNPTLWNNWRASLMRQLYNATRKALKSGRDQAVDRQELIDETHELARKQLNDRGVQNKPIDKIWSYLDDNYFLRETAADIVWHTELLIKNDESKKPTVKVKPFVNYSRERATIVFARVPTSPYLFYSVATAIGNAGFSIQDVRLYATKKSSFLTVYLLDESAEPLAQNQQNIKKLTKTLKLELETPEEQKSSTGKRTSRRLKQFPVATQTFFDNSGSQSTLEVITADRPRLLAAIAEIFLKHGIYICSAKITTLGERVEDLFIIEDADGNPIRNENLITAVQDDICTTIDQQVEATSV